jgi:Rrf2 family protein
VLRINRETDYAIRVLLALAKQPPGKIIPSAVIRKDMDLPESLSLQIVSRLAHHNFINTYPGRNGGIQLSDDPRNLNLLQVIIAFEGPLYISECLKASFDCSLEPGCPVQKQWLSLQKFLEDKLKNINFKDLVNEFQPENKLVVQ